MQELTSIGPIEHLLDHLIAGRVISDDYHGEFTVLPKDFRVHDLEHLRETPRRIREKIRLHTAESFLAYVQRFKNDASTIFANKETTTFIAVIDYHYAEEAEPQWCNHTATYACPLSKEWKAWTTTDGKKLNQIQFAEFLEERVADITEPAGGELLAITTAFHVVRNSVFGSVQRLATGEFSVQYSQENQKGSVEFPETITLGIAPFHAGEKYEVKARVRYRLDEGKLALWYQLIDPELVIEHAFNEVRATIAKESELDVFDGTKD